MADRTHSERINFGKLREVIQPPNLIELQISSYLEYLQKDTPEKQRKPFGLEAVFKEVFPINSYDERLTLEASGSALLGRRGLSRPAPSSRHQSIRAGCGRWWSSRSWVRVLSPKGHDRRAESESGLQMANPNRAYA